MFWTLPNNLEDGIRDIAFAMLKNQTMKQEKNTFLLLSMMTSSNSKSSQTFTSKLDYKKKTF